MGCHGIGVSRLIGAVAAVMSDATGLNWPRAIAPFEVVVVATKELEDDAVKVYDSLASGGGVRGGDTSTFSSSSPRFDALIDDRERSLMWKLRDADTVGYPVIIVLGRAWKSDRKCEVQCRRLGKLRTEVAFEELPGFVGSLLQKL